MEKKQIGVLAVQGAFAEHIAMVRKLGAEAFEIRQLPDLERPMDGLILPGGESTAMRKLLDELGLYEPLRAKIAAGLPVYGTCAGLLLLAKEIEGGTPCFATMDVSAVRNAYGRQLGSFYTEAEFAGLGTIPMTFIRAPYITSLQVNVGIQTKNTGLLPGMVTEVWLQDADKSQACVLPANVLQLDEHNNYFVWLKGEDGKASKRVVMCGKFTATGVTVVNGLNEGDEVIVEGQQKVCEGTPLAL